MTFPPSPKPSTKPSTKPASPPLHLVNPQRIKAFGMQKLRRNKSDTTAAKLIASLLKSEHADLRPWQPRSLPQRKITALSRCADSLTQAAAMRWNATSSRSSTRSTMTA